jgi:hypothetical protein
LTYGGSPWARDHAIQKFYFAEPLKRMCIDILGCPEDKVYGTDDDKNVLIEHLLWENFPVPVYNMPDGSIYVHSEGTKDPRSVVYAEYMERFVKWVKETNYHPQHGPPDESLDHGSAVRKTGPMSVREVLQYWGTEIFRRQYQDVWADACIRAVRKSNTVFAVITDCRFANEVEAVQKAGGRVVRLTRIVFPNDMHVSETSLDPKKFDWGRFDFVIDNSKMGVEYQCRQLYNYLHNILNWIPDYPLDIIQECVRRAST